TVKQRCFHRKFTWQFICCTDNCPSAPLIHLEVHFSILHENGISIAVITVRDQYPFLRAASHRLWFHVSNEADLLIREIRNLASTYCSTTLGAQRQYGHPATCNDTFGQ